jgi:hypothetical protein
MTMRFGYNLSTYIKDRWWKVGGERFKWRNGWQRTADGSSPVRIE